MFLVRHRRRRVGARAVARVLVVAVVTAGVVAVPAVALAAPTGGETLAVNDLPTVISNLQDWIMGILAALATLFAVVGFARYMTAGGDPSQAESAKGALKAAAVGYAGALLVPVFMTILKGILGV